MISVANANPNGDPMTNNLPRVTYEGLGEISDVCIKRKLRNRLMDMGYPVFVQPGDRTTDGLQSLQARADADAGLKKAEKDGDRDGFMRIACKKWIDVRSFGQVFAFRGSEVSLGVRGPVSVHPAFSIEPVTVVSTRITRSADAVSGKEPDRTGMKHRVERGIYVVYGGISSQLAEKTGFTEEDAEAIRTALGSLFDNDASAARPEGSMEVREVYWWRHDSRSGRYSSAMVHRSITVTPLAEAPFYTVARADLAGLTPEVYEGR